VTLYGNCCGVSNSSSLERLPIRTSKIVSKMSDSDKALYYLKVPSLVNKRENHANDPACNYLKTISLLIVPCIIAILGK